MKKKKSIGLPGGPNEFLQNITQYISVEGYKSNSPDINNPFNIIESSNITMEGVDFPVKGEGNNGVTIDMQPGVKEYNFGNADYVVETPLAVGGGAIRQLLKNLPEITKAVGKNIDEAVEYFSKNVEEFKDYIAKFSDDSKTILPEPAVTDVKTPLKLPFNQRGQIIPQQHVTSGNYSSNSAEAIDHIYGDGPMWFAPIGDTRYINTSMNSEFIPGLGKEIKRPFTDFIGNTGKKGFDEFPLTEAEKLKKAYGGYYPKVVDGELVPNLDDPIMRTSGRFNYGLQNTIEGVFDPNSRIKIIDGQPSRLGHSTEGNWDNTKIGQYMDEGYDIVQVIDEYTGDQLENILLPNSKNKFKITSIDGMPVEIVNPEFKKGGSVSWNWKGKSYSGTLIPSMETSKARYARTKNGKIKTLPKAQDGNLGTIKYGTPEYKEAYDAGQITSVGPDGMPLINLDEVKITVDKNTGKNILEDYPKYYDLTEEDLEYWNNPGPIGRGVRRKARVGPGGSAEEARDFVTAFLGKIPLQSLSIPQGLLVEGVEGLRGNDFDLTNAIIPGETRYPSDVWGFENKPGWDIGGSLNTTMDVVADPLNLVGAGILTKTLKPTVLSKVDDVLKVGAKSTDDIVKQTDEFVSEINWSKWNKDIPNNKSLMDEYADIEKSAKANGTWMKNSDGSPFTLPDGSPGLPEQFVQTRSKNFKNAYPKGMDVTYRGSDQHIPEGMRGDYSKIYNNDAIRPEVGSGLFTGDIKLASKYGKGYYGIDNPNLMSPSLNPFFTPNQRTLFEIPSDQIQRNIRGKNITSLSPSEPGGIYKLAIPRTNNKISFDANQKDWTNLADIDVWNMMPKDVQDAAIRARAGGKKGAIMYDPNTPSFGGYSTDDVATMVEKLGLDRAEIRNVYDFGIGDVLVHNNKKGNFAKSLFGNDGSFNLLDKNIYKSVAPLTIGGYGLSQQQKGPGTDTGIKWQDLDVNFDGIRKALKKVESADGTLMINEDPKSTATGYYGQRFSEIKDLYDGTRVDFSKDIDAQERFFKDRFYKGVKANKTTPLLKDAYDLTVEYKDQLGDDWNFSYEDVIALSNFLGRGGARKYFGDVIRDGKSLEEVFPKSYGVNKEVTNKTPEEYLSITREYYQYGGENIYKVKRGDNLSKIARAYGTTVDDIVSINDISNPSMINIDQEILLPENAQAASSNFYEVKEGDTLGKIAKRFNTSYQRLAEVNNISDPNFIRRGQSLKLPDEYREEIPLAEESWISVDTLQRNTDDINALADEDVIIKSQMINDPNQRYVVIDKKNQRLKLYHGDEVITDFEVATGKNSGDAQTVTYAKDIDGDGKITEADKVNGQYKVDWSKGNLSTGAGKYTMSTSSPTSRDYYNNAPSFNMVNEAGIEVSTAIHGAPDFRLKYFDNEDINDNRSSNGCINGKCSDLQGLYDMGLPTGTPIFILPEDEGNKFELVDGQAVLRMSKSNRENYQGYEREQGQSYDGQGGNYSTNTLRYKPIRAKFDEAGFREEIFTAFDFNDEAELYHNTIPFINALVDNKKEIMQASKITSDVYNKIAKIAFGIYGTESNYGDTHSAAGNFSRAVNKALNPSQSSSPDVVSKYNTYGADEDDNSVGYTQIRWVFLNDTEKAALKKFNITKNADMLDPEKSAIATAVVLGIRYNEQLTPDQKKNPMLFLPAKWNNRTNYAERVKNNSRFLNFEQFDRMRSGGEVEERIIYSNYISGMYDGTKSEKMGIDVYDKLNRQHLRHARELGISPANYVMTYVIGNS